MVPALREAYNKAFTEEKYQEFLNDLHGIFPGAIDFRVAETPVFIPASFRDKMLETCESIIDFITSPSFRDLTDRAIPASEKVPHEKGPSHMIAFDFGICEDSELNLVPQLIEMQGFPTLYGFQVLYPEIIPKHFPVPTNYHQYLGNHDKFSYLKLLREVIVGDIPVENVVLLEIRPHQQKTRIDFYATQHYLGVTPVCVTELVRDGNRLCYLRDGITTPIRRIYNRVIFDELNAVRESLGEIVDITGDLEVDWVPHPNWFYRISKFTIPFIRHPYVPETYFLNEIKELPNTLSDYVLKPLFSFAGQGVIIDVEQRDIDAIKDPENWILQRKVKYAEVIKTPNTPAKAEIRIMYLWKEGKARPEPVINLARISKGKMIGVRYNKDLDWVGGSVAFFEH